MTINYQPSTINAPKAPTINYQPSTINGAKGASRRGFSLVELLIAMVISTILVLGMGGVLVTMFVGMQESAEFAEATGRVDLIRMLTFDARAGDEILFPASDGSGAYSSGGNEGHMVRFNSVQYDPNTDTTSDMTVQWESVRASTEPAGAPFTVYRWVDEGSGMQRRFTAINIDRFEIERTSEKGFSVELETREGDEIAAVSLAVSLRNVR